MRPGVRDLPLALVLAALSVIGPALEESYRDLWTYLPLSLAGLLTCSGILLLLPSRMAKIPALAVHGLIALVCAVALLISALFLVTILLAGTALVLAPPALILGLNSAATLWQYFRGAEKSRSARVHQTAPATGS